MLDFVGCVRHASKNLKQMSGLGLHRRCRRRALAPRPPSLLVLVAATVLAASHCPPASGLQAGDIVVVVLSQVNSHHVNQAQLLKDDIHRQALALSETVPVVHLTHEDFPHPGAWTVLPILPKLSALHSRNSSWIFFCEERTKINLLQILSIFELFYEKEEIWIGHGLYDREASIIHHFAFSKNPEQFKYPSFASGFAMTTTLLQR